MVKYLLNFRVSKSSLWLSNVFLAVLNGCRTSLSFSMATFSLLFFWYLWRYRQGICRQNDTMGVRGQKCPHSLSSWSPLLEEGDFLGIHWGCRNRRQPLKADLKEQRAQSLRGFLGKAVLLYSYSLHSTRLRLIDNIITHLFFSSTIPTYLQSPFLLWMLKVVKASVAAKRNFTWDFGSWERLVLFPSQELVQREQCNWRWGL